MKRVRIEKKDLNKVFDELGQRYKVLGPKVVNGTIILSEICYDDIPAGYKDCHGAGSYRLTKGESEEVFSFSPGPDSLKKFLHPPEEEVLAFRKTARSLALGRRIEEQANLAFMGVRACDLVALELLDRVFTDVAQQSHAVTRRGIFIVAVNCIYPGENCFCASMDAGPSVKNGYDILLTEIPGAFLLEAGSSEGERLLGKLPHVEAQNRDLEEKTAVVSKCRQLMGKSVKTGDLPGILYNNMEHPRWAEIAEKDLECGNCTMVCPTCFCSSSYDMLSLSSISGNLREFSGVRKRNWDSCFSKNFARVHGGNFRPSRRARYRHWMTHKLAYWIDQFGRPGCVGCGRCITWCPVGLDITHELEEIRHVR